MNDKLGTDRACALITGGGQGLGLALAHGCARRGFDLLLVALPGSGLDEAAQILQATYGVRCQALAQDLTAPDGPEAVARWATDLGWPLACLINNAGVSYNSRFEDSTLDENEAVILVNNLAPVKLTHLLLPELRTVNLPETLITPSLYQVGDELCIDVENRRSRVRLTKVVESTGSFAQYQFAFLGGIADADPIRDDVAEKSREFSSIWGSI